MEFTLSDITGSGFPPGLQRLDFFSQTDGNSDWAMLIPPADSKCHTWIISIHGHGANGRQLFVRSDVRRNWLPDFLASGCGILSPNLRGSLWMNDMAAADLDQLLLWLKEHYQAERFIFFSGSMGGTSTLLYACHAPHNVAGMAIMGSTCDMTDYYWFCRKNTNNIQVLDEIRKTLENLYGGSPLEVPEHYLQASALYDTDILKQIPIYLCHGENDELMPVQQARLLAKSLADAPHFIYDEMSGIGHDGPMLRKTTALEWLLKVAK